MKVKLLLLSTILATLLCIEQSNAPFELMEHYPINQKVGSTIVINANDSKQFYDFAISKGFHIEYLSTEEKDRTVTYRTSSDTGLLVEMFFYQKSIKERIEDVRRKHRSKSKYL